jgi:hypothetical protein
MIEIQSNAFVIAQALQPETLIKALCGGFQA